MHFMFREGVERARVKKEENKKHRESIDRQMKFLQWKHSLGYVTSSDTPGNLS